MLGGRPGGRGAETVPLGGAWVTPGLVDCHTHLVFGGNRAGEYEQRLNGASYEEIARAGGAPQGQMGAPYPGTCRRLDPAERAAKRADATDYAWRLDVGAALARTVPLFWYEDGRRIPAEPLAVPA